MRNTYLLLIVLITGATSVCKAQSLEKIIFASGSLSNNKAFIKYVAGLTKKENPRICFVPTASADNPYGIAAWYAACVDVPVRPYVLRTFLNSSPEQQTF